MKHITLILLFVLMALPGLRAQDKAAGNLWQDIEKLQIQGYDRSQVPLPGQFRLLRLDAGQMERSLLSAPERSAMAVGQSPARLEIPLPDGTTRQFRIRRAPAMHPDLAKKFPKISSYEGQGVDDPFTRIYFAYSQLGFYGMVLSEGTDPVFVTPIVKEDAEHYLSYYEKDFDPEQDPIYCGVQSAGRPAPGLGFRGMAGDCQLRVFRLAVAADAEFTAASASVADPTGVNNAMATINNMVTVINGVYQSELAIQLQLVANNNLLIFTNAATDGYTDGNQNAMAGENQGIVDGIIGSGNYDIAHALGVNAGTGSAGVSLGIGTACNNGSKAMGATVVGNVALTPGIVTLIMHEFGHQFGADHTFNESTQPICSNAGQLNPATAFEPGSGSTIMSYAGTCGTSNVQGPRDRYFHAISLQQISNYVTAGGGSCPTPTPTGNNQPTVSAGGDFSIPVSTPFMLTATGNDTDGDALTYCWEQMDNTIITHPPQASAAAGPVFRTQLPTASPIRFFPNLPAVVAGTAPTWEVLPGVGRKLNFRVTVRDNVAAFGCTDEDDMMVTTVGGIGPFVVTVPAGSACLFAGENATVNWNVANTDQAPVSCASVDIFLSTDGGLTFPTLLLAGTPNDGSADVTLPEVRTEQARIMVKGSNNIFFNVNPGDFTIDCVPNLVVTDNPAFGNYKARFTLETMGTVNVLTAAQFFAGDEITLNPGFRAVPGSDFLARLQACDPCDLTPSERIAGNIMQPEIAFVPAGPRGLATAGGEKHAPFDARIYPNPFAGEFTVEFELQKSSEVYIQLVDIAGRTARVVYRSSQMEAGTHRIPLNGAGLAPGVYECQIATGDILRRMKAVKVEY